DLVGGGKRTPHVPPSILAGQRDLLAGVPLPDDQIRSQGNTQDPRYGPPELRRLVVTPLPETRFGQWHRHDEIGQGHERLARYLLSQQRSQYASMRDRTVEFESEDEVVKR